MGADTGCRQLQPRCGARRFGAWAFIRHAPSVVGMERYGHSNELGSITCVDPHHRWGHAVIGELAAVAVSEPHAASRRQRISPSRIP